MWTTEIVRADDHWQVYLLRDGKHIATMTLDEWASLSATQQVARSEEPQAPYRHE